MTTDKIAIFSKINILEQKIQVRTVKYKLLMITLISILKQNWQLTILRTKILFLVLFLNVPVNRKEKFKLPKIELRFDGEIKNQLCFWNQFQRVNDDEDVAPENKEQKSFRRILRQRVAENNTG